MVEDIFLLYVGGTPAPEVPPQGPSRAILMHEVLAAGGYPHTSAEGFLHEEDRSLPYMLECDLRTPPRKGQVIQDAN